MAVADPTLRVERAMHREGVRFVIGCDEVGRGAIAGPVGVGLSVVGVGVRKHPDGLRDSKMLSEKRREELAPLASSWSLFSAVGLASSQEVDSIGILSALGLAGLRALSQLHEAGLPIHESVVLLDGSFDWLSPALREPPVAGSLGGGIAGSLTRSGADVAGSLTRSFELQRARVRLRVKADRDCASVAAASVIAKVHRDRLMIEANDTIPGYGWRGNKGYGSTEHYAAIDTLGPSELHRHTWLHA